MTRVAVLGHTALNIAPAVAADLASRGHDVAWWPSTPAAQEAGGLRLAQAGASGDDRAVRVRTPPSAEGALLGAVAVIVDCGPDRLLPFMAPLAAELPQRAVVHLQSHGYWPASRLARQSWAGDRVWADSSAPTHAAAFDGLRVQLQARRQGLRFASLHGDALPTLRSLYGEAAAADCPLETGLESINLMVHPGGTAANLAALDRAASQGCGFSFYDRGNTETAERLALALDHERRRVCGAFGVRQHTLVQTLNTLYGARGDTPRQAIADCPFYRHLGELPAHAPAQWARIDLPYALIPLLRLARTRDVAAPVHEALVVVLSTAFGFDPWAAALTLDDLGVES